MTLAEVIDLEALLLSDEAQDPIVLHQRDRGLSAEIPMAAGRRQALRAWLAAAGSGGIGARVVRALRWLWVACLLLGANLGWGLGAVLFAYDGQTPINVLDTLLVAVGGQLALFVLGLVPLVLSLSGASGGRWLPQWPLTAAARRGLGWLLDRLTAPDDPIHQRLERASYLLDRARLRNRRYARLEGLLLTAMLQTTALVFNVGLLACMLRMVVVTDLTFGWSTTLQVGAATLHAFTDAVALPWASWLPQAVPSAELIEATRFTRLDGTFGGQRDAEIAAMSGAWWPFLVAAITTYGALPRLLAAGTALAMIWRERRQVLLDDARLDAVWRRLNTPLVESGGGGDRGVTAMPEAAEQGDLTAAGQPLGIRWRGGGPDEEALLRAARTCLQLTPSRICAAGGMDYAADLALLEALEDEPPPSVVVFANAWESPDKGTRRFLGQLRAAIGEQPVLSVLLIGGDAEALDLWRRMLQLLEDPALLVERAPDA